MKIKPRTCTLLSDDLVVLASTTNVKSLKTHMNRVLNRLSEWADYNCMTVTRKLFFTVVSFNKVSRNSSPVQSNNFTRQESTKSLEMNLESKLTFSKHVVETAEKG